MVGYTTFGTNDLPKAIAYFDALFAEVGVKQAFNTGRIVAYGEGFGNGLFAICEPFNKEPATPGNGVMVALNLGNKEAVQKLHAKALALGGTDEGAPGERGTGFYGGYFRDPDGNKFCGFCTLG